MKRVGALFLLMVVLCGFTQIDYDNIMLGTPIVNVTRKYGEPYAVRDLGNKMYEYVYIERFAMNNELMYENHYLLTVVNGQIVNKKIKEQTRPGYDQLWQPDPNYPSYP